MPDIVIRVGAARDASLSTVFAPLEQASKRAKQRLGADAVAAGDGVAKGAKRGTDSAEREFAELAKEAAKYERQIAREADKSARDQVRAAQQATKEKMKLLAQQAKSAERAAAQEARASEQAAKASARAQASEAKALAKRSRTVSRGETKFDPGGTAKMLAAQAGGSLGRGLIRGGKAVLGAGVGALRSGLEGAGVDFSLSDAVGANTRLEANAAALSNSGYMEGQAGPNGVRQDPKKLAGEIRGTATATGFDLDTASEGMQAFVSKTGDLDGARKTFGGIAVIAKATNTDLKDMANAAADIWTHLKDGPDKAERLGAALRVVAQQGKDGAVEISDLADQMAKVTAAAGDISGDSSRNIAVLGGFAQEARQKGGASSASQATTSIGSFMATFDKGAREKAFKGFGVNTRADDGGIADPRQVILDALNAASAKKNGGMGSFANNMGQMFADRGARRVTKGFEQTYRQTYADTKGGAMQRQAAATAAVSAEMDKLTNATMSTAEVQKELATSLSTTQSQTQILNNKFAEAAAQLDGPLKLAIAKFGGAVTPVVSALGGVVAWATGITSDVNGTGDQVGHELVARGDVHTADAAIKSGQISKEDYEAIMKHKGDLEGTIDDRQRHLAGASWDDRTRFGTGNAVKTDEQLRARLKEGGLFGPSDSEKTQIGNVLQERQAIAGDREVLAHLKAIAVGVNKADDKNAILSVRIVGGGNAMPPKADTTNVPNGAPGMPPGFDH